MAPDTDLYRRPSPQDEPVRRFLLSQGIDPDGAVDLGGTMSLNIHAEQAGLVLRIHPRFVSRARVTRLNALRRHLADCGLIVGAPQRLGRGHIVEVGDFLAEAETFVAHTKPVATWDSYVWMYQAMGALHSGL